MFLSYQYSLISGHVLLEVFRADIRPTINALIFDINCDKAENKYGQYQEHNSHYEGDHPEVSSSIIYHVANIMPLEVSIKWVVRWYISGQAISKNEIL